MTTKQQEDQQRTSQEKQGRQQLNAVIGKHVMHTLGQPDNLQSVQVRQLWGDRYRVNVFAGVDSASAKVIHSYFLVADSDGNIVEVTPKITRQY
jgi:hypothetical protein